MWRIDKGEKRKRGNWPKVLCSRMCASGEKREILSSHPSWRSRSQASGAARGKKIMRDARPRRTVLLSPPRQSRTRVAVFVDTWIKELDSSAGR